MSGRSGFGRGQYKGQSFVGVKDTASATIAPAASTVAANSVEERAYTTGLAALGLKANDIVVVNPMTALASGLGIAYVRCQSADTLRIGWQNSSAGATAPTATDYLVGVQRRNG